MWHCLLELTRVTPPLYSRQPFLATLAVYSSNNCVNFCRRHDCVLHPEQRRMSSNHLLCSGLLCQCVVLVGFPPWRDTAGLLFVVWLTSMHDVPQRLEFI